jgi:hypothetical protein
MTDTELIAALRSRREWVRHSGISQVEPDPLSNEGADLIESLLAERDAALAREAMWQREASGYMAERDALRADAERYRWLRDKCQWSDVRAEFGWQGDVPGGLDTAIDAAMKEGKA